MSNLAKIAWTATMLIICGIGIFAGNHRNPVTEGNGAALTEARFSVSAIEAELCAAYPEFSGVRNIEIGLARTTNSGSALELTVTDRAGNRYLCLIGRTGDGWRIERTKRLKVAAMGAMT